jgi:ferritin-like metal-binding protein YciE
MHAGVIGSNRFVHAPRLFQRQRTYESDMKTLKNLFLDELADMYDAEHRFISSLPKMAKAAISAELKKTMRVHLKESERHVKKLERVFKAFGRTPKRRTCDATVGLLKEVHEIGAQYKGAPALDAALISGAQKVAHHQIAAYGCLREWAGLLGKADAAGLLQEVLDDKQAANEAFTELASATSNQEALCGADTAASANGHDATQPGWRRGNPATNGHPKIVLPTLGNDWQSFRRRR